MRSAAHRFSSSFGHLYCSFCPLGGFEETGPFGLLVGGEWPAFSVHIGVRLGVVEAGWCWFPSSTAEVGKFLLVMPVAWDRAGLVW